MIYNAFKATLAIKQENGATVQQLYKRPGEVFAGRGDQGVGCPEGGVTDATGRSLERTGR
jgi:hypothetical protein